MLPFIYWLQNGYKLKDALFLQFAHKNVINHHQNTLKIMLKENYTPFCCGYCIKMRC